MKQHTPCSRHTCAWCYTLPLHSKQGTACRVISAQCTCISSVSIVIVNNDKLSLNVMSGRLDSTNRVSTYYYEGVSAVALRCWLLHMPCNVLRAFMHVLSHVMHCNGELNVSLTECLTVLVLRTLTLSNIEHKHQHQTQVKTALVLLLIWHTPLVSSHM